MAGPRIANGTFGDIAYTNLSPGRMPARTRCRDWDGVTRQMQATAATRMAAAWALKAKLSDRSLFQPEFATLTPDSCFGDLVTY